MQCLNCGREFEGAHCPECGYHVHTERLSFRMLMQEVVNAFDLERGIFRTIVLLFSKPGPAIRGYIARNRMLYSPIRLLLLTGAISTFLAFKFYLFGVYDANRDIGIPDYAAFTDYSGRYFSLTSIIGIPIFSLFSWLLFRSPPFSYIENLVLNTYIASGQFLILIFFAPIIVTFPGPLVLVTYGIINALYNGWVLLAVFKVRWLSGLIRCLTTLSLSFVCAYWTNYFLYRLYLKDLVGFIDA